MKKSIFSLLLFVFFIDTANAQIKTGGKVGGNLAGVKNIGDENNSSRVGFNAGAVAQIGISKKFVIQPELLFSLKGYKFPPTNFNSSGTLSLNYVVIPLLAGFQPSENVTILFGPELGFLTSVNSRFDGANHDVSKNFRKTDIGINLGTALHIKEGVGIEARYSYGFNELADVIYTDNLGNEIGRGRTGANRVFQIGLYYLFKVK
jgi:hypothetical protein